MQLFEPGEAAIPTRPRLLPEGWPFYALFLGFPLWWILGLSAFVWPLFAIPMAGSLYMRRTILFPRSYWIWMVFLLWTTASVVEITRFTSIFTFGYRLALYLAATVIFLYVLNERDRALPTDRVLRTLTIFWMYVVAGGYLGLVFRHASFKSLLELVLPGSLGGNQFVQELVHLRFAQIQVFLGFPSPRPSAPFTFTNDWGGNFALLIPLVFASWALIRSSRWRLLVLSTLLVSVIPAVVSVNRGLWLSLGLGLVYATLRFLFRGSGRGAGALIALFAIVAVLLFATPLRGIVDDRLAHQHSNKGRLFLYEQALTSIGRSPVLGFGVPQAYAGDDRKIPLVGTQGQFWLVMISSGIPAAALFVLWFLAMLWRSRRGGSMVRFWAHVVIFIGALQIPYYGLLPVQIQLVMISAALAWRESLVSEEPVTGDAGRVAEAPAFLTRSISD
jgi:hypothetical protein